MLYLPDIDEWFETISESAKVSLVQAVENNLPSHVLFFATTLKPFSDLPEYIQDMFTRNNTNIGSPSSGKITINCDHPSVVLVILIVISNIAGREVFVF